MNIKTFEEQEKAIEFIKTIDFNSEKKDYWSFRFFNSKSRLWEVIYGIIPIFEVGNKVKINTFSCPEKYIIVINVEGTIINKKYLFMGINSKRYSFTVKFENDLIISDIFDSELSYFVFSKKKEIEKIKIKPTSVSEKKEIVEKLVSVKEKTNEKNTIETIKVEIKK